MPADSQRTEKPTKRRIDKSRREGQFPASRELVAAAQFVALVCLLSAGAGAFVGRMREMLGYFLTHAFAVALTPRTVVRLYRGLLERIFLPLLWMGGCLMAV